MPSTTTKMEFSYRYSGSMVMAISPGMIMLLSKDLYTLELIGDNGVICNAFIEG